ncbi:MAG: DUF805 domain-containing protein [Verrucomicrobia bacterium]|jgi:uncharacterized membrane protein YhaH (DUF805 family)|nr:DUF805 domain-containing protein [Verrucomicrobiota bacterium]
MKDTFISSEGRIGRFAYILRLLILVAVAVAASWAAIAYFDQWHGGDYSPLGPFLGIVVGLFCALIGLMQFLKRLHDIDKPGYWSLFLLLPGVNVLVLLYAAVVPSKEA